MSDEELRRRLRDMIGSLDQDKIAIDSISYSCATREYEAIILIAIDKDVLEGNA